MIPKLKLYLQEMRAPFFTASIIPVLLGTSIAYHESGTIQWFHFVLTLIGGVLLHAGMNVINDYFDHLSHDDDVNKEFVRPFTGGSRMIQNGLLTPKEVLIEGLICIGLGSAIGLYLWYKVGVIILILGIIGVFTGFFYSAPPFYLVSRGIGEFFIGLNFGALMTLGAYSVQTGEFSWQPIVASLPVACLIAAVLYINEFQDYAADKQVGKDQLVVRLGKERAVKGYMVIMLLTYLSLVLGVVTDTLPPILLIGLLTLPLAYKSVKVAQTFYNDSTKLAPANATTIMNHLATGLLLVVAFLIDRIL
jgi:1,4-dihydroxy-2-naphthoate polyprenyltransferase